MKRGSLIALLAALMIMAGSILSFADSGLTINSTYPEDGQKNTSMENLGVKIEFNNAINSDEAKKADESKFHIKDSEGNEVPVKVLFNEKKNEVLVVADDYTAKNNEQYTLTVDAGVVDNDGNTLAKAKTVKFTTYNQRVNNLVNMGMMFVMFGGIIFFTMRQNNKKEEEEKKDEPKESFNPYKEAKRTGKSVEEIKAEQAKKEAKLAKKQARKNKKGEEEKYEKRIANCAALLNNVYHVHAPAPTNKEDRSMEAMKAARKASKKK